MDFERVSQLPADTTNYVGDIANFAQNPGFEQRPFAYGAVALGALGVGAVFTRYRNMKREAESIAYPDPDIEKTSQHRLKRHRIAGAVAGVLATTAMTSAALHEAEPYTEESHNLINNAVVVIDTSWNAYAADVADGNEVTTRLEASVNSIGRLDNLSGVDVNFVAAGPQAERIGTISNGQGRTEVSDNFSDYIANPRNRSDSDLAGAIEIANATEADKILVFTGSVDNATNRFRQAAEEDRVSVIVAGTPGTTIRYLGSDREAQMDVAGIENTVGSDNTYTVTTIEDIQETVTSIASEQYVETIREEFDGFESARNATAAMVVVGVAMKMFGGAIGAIRNRRSRASKGEK